MDRSMLSTDAVPQRIPQYINENESDITDIESLLNEFSKEDYVSVFFLLMDFITPEKFLVLTKKDKPLLKKTFIDLYRTHLSDKLLMELFDTMKLYKKLRMMGTCHHLCEIKEEEFNQINHIWKILYSLCEELTDDELEILKQSVPLPDLKDQILYAEDWFCWALLSGLFSRTDLLGLENVFKNYPNCLNIIKGYSTNFGFYDIRTPTASSHCGIALIFNYDTFDKEASLEKRDYAEKDVSSLKKLWDVFGFKTEVCNNLTSKQTFEVMEKYASMDHSDYDAFVCCILSHGQSNAFYSSDGELIPVPVLLTPVVNECLSLNKKPKLLFIQACQGTNFHQGAGKPVCSDNTANLASTKSSYSSVPPVIYDTLIVNASIDGYVSFRDSNGSWFIQTLFKRMMQYGDNTPIEEVMIKVSTEVRTNYSADLDSLGLRNLRQFIHRQSTLEKKLILKKKLFGSSNI